MVHYCFNVCRKPGLGDAKPQYFVSDRSLYSERATTAFPSSNASDIMSAMDDLHDEESQAPSGYYWAYGGASGAGNAPNRGVGGKHAAGVPSAHPHDGRTLSADMLSDDKLTTGIPSAGILDGGKFGGDTFGASGGVPVDVHAEYFHHDDVDLPRKEKHLDYATITSSKTVQSAQILNHRKYGSKINKATSDSSSTTN
jgi:hypothetical protein